MDNYIKKHVDELYATGKTTFRDIDGEYPDDTRELEDLVCDWALDNDKFLILVLFGKNRISVDLEIHGYIESEIKQLCIAYYEDE